MNDFFNAKNHGNSWHGFSSFLGLLLFFHVDIHYFGRDTTYLWHYRYHIWKHTIQTNQVGEMFANYNLIAAIAFLLPLLAKYTN
jgi:hypothetical protein